MLVSTFAVAAAAQERGGEEQSEAMHSVDLDGQEARAHFSLGQLHFSRDRFPEAAREFEAAFGLVPHPELLYNAYLAWRDAGEQRESARVLRTLLALPELTDALPRERLQARLDALEVSLAERAELESRLQQAEERASRPNPETTQTSWLPGWALLGGGAAIAIAGSITGGAALSLYDSVSARCSNNLCPPETESDRETGQGLTIATDVLLPLGVALAATGLVLALVLSSESTTSVQAVCTDTGCAVGVGGQL